MMGFRCAVISTVSTVPSTHLFKTHLLLSSESQWAASSMNGLSPHLAGAFLTPNALQGART